jgi:hypothetical protein
MSCSNADQCEICVLQSISRNFDHKCSASLRSSQVRCEVQKFIMRFTNQFVNYAFDWLLLIQGPIRDFVYKLACEFQYELANICGSSEHLWSKFREIDCNMRSRLSLGLFFHRGAEKKTEPGYAGYPLVGNKTKKYQVMWN